MSIYFLSDLHLFHDKEFLWGQRGFSDVEQMNAKILENINNTITAEDDFIFLEILLLGAILSGLKKSLLLYPEGFI